MYTSFKLAAVLAIAGTLSACGETDIERASPGAIIGAAAAAVTGEDVVNGALIGGAVGAVSCSVAPGTPGCI